MAPAHNVGSTDKAVRIVMGIMLIAFALLSDTTILWKAVVGIAAAIALLTAVIGFCPINKLLNINTCRHEF